MNYIEVMRQALNALESVNGKGKKCEEAEKVLKQAIIEAERLQPVAWMYRTSDGYLEITNTDQRPIENAWPDFEKSTPLYTAPPPSKPMTDEKISSVLSAFPKCASNWADCDFYDFARAIEAAKD